MGGQDEVAALEALSVFCRSQRCLVHAKANLESVVAEEGLETRVAEISLKNKKGTQTQANYSLCAFLLALRSDATVILSVAQS